MADEEVATKAPENDAQEATFQLHEDDDGDRADGGSIIPGDTAVDQSSATMGVSSVSV